MESKKIDYDNMDQIPLVTLDNIDPERRAYFERMYVQAKLDGTIKSDTCSVFHRKFIFPDPVPIEPTSPSLE